MQGFKRKLGILIFLSLVSVAFGQTEIQEPTQDPSVRFRLFRTTNIWTFIQLDTISGRMWQVHFDIKGDSRGRLSLSMEHLAKGKQEVLGRFTLYPTTNIYTFILMDQVDGATWQVQWSFDKDYRLIIPIGN